MIARRLARLLAVLAVLGLGATVATGAAQDPQQPTTTTPTTTIEPVPKPSPTTPSDPNPCLRTELRLRCPDLIMRRPYGLHLLRTPAGRSLLASTNAIVNIGVGPLEIRGRRTGRRGMAARQVIRAKSLSADRVMPEDGRIIFFNTGTRGTYWKFEDAAGFELWALDADGARTRLVRTGPKIYYCYRDLRRVSSLIDGAPYPQSPRWPRFGACSQTGPISSVTLGTSVGWADIYPWRYPQNWIDVSGFTGCFAYVHRADPAEHFAELREDNNTSALSVRLPWRGSGGARGCPAVKLGRPPRTAGDPKPKQSDAPPENPYKYRRPYGR